MSFCRITGRSRNLPKPHYFPIIKPISPAEAQRCCKITGKSYGLPMHHYVPVLLRKATILTKCRITKVADLYGQRKHHLLDGFRYVRPIIDTQPRLLELLTTKLADGGQFVYTVKERRTSLVFPAQLELAVRDGDIEDVMLNKESDQVLLKMKCGDPIMLPIEEIDEDCWEDELFEGEGVAAEPRQATMSIARMFEDKQQQQQADEAILKKKIRNKNVIVNSDDWRNLIEPLLNNCDWIQFEESASKCIDIAKWTPSDNIQAKYATDIPHRLSTSSPFQIIHDAVSKLTDTELQQTDNISTKLSARMLGSLPLVHEIPDLVHRLTTGTPTKLNNIAGTQVFTKDKVRRFIVGQTVATKNGKVFVPGQSVCGTSFLPGFVVYTNDGPALVPGVIVAKQKHSPVFLAGQNLMNSDTGRYEFHTEHKLIACRDLQVQQQLDKNPIEMVEAYEIELKDGTELIRKRRLSKLDEFVNTIPVELANNIDTVKSIVQQSITTDQIDKICSLVVSVVHCSQQFLNTSPQCKGEVTHNCDLLNKALLTCVQQLQIDNNVETVVKQLTEIFATSDYESIDNLCNLINQAENCQTLFDNVIKHSLEQQKITEFNQFVQQLPQMSINTTVPQQTQHLLTAILHLTKAQLPQSIPTREQLLQVCGNEAQFVQNCDILNKAIDIALSDQQPSIKLSEMFANAQQVNELCVFLNKSANDIITYLINEKIYKHFNEFVNQIHVENVQLNLAQKFAQNFPPQLCNPVSNLLVTVAYFAQNYNSVKPLQNGDLSEFAHSYDILKNALLTAVVSNQTVQEPNIFETLNEIFINLENSEQTIYEMCKLLNLHSCQTVFAQIINDINHKLPNVSKTEILKSAILSGTQSNELLIDKLSTIIEEDLLAPAFRSMATNNPTFLRRVVASLHSDTITDDQSAYESLQVAIVNAIKEQSEQQLNEFLQMEDKPAITELLEEAIGLATALGMYDTADSLNAIIGNPQSTELIANDPLTIEILKRLTLMRQIAKRQPLLRNALVELRQNQPQSVRCDPKLRQLVRESAVLLVPHVSKKVLNTSECIPSSLFGEYNTLAMEDFVTRNRQPGTLLIIKRGLQAVVPKEASRAVLNGQVAYTLIDETGIKHFKPLDVFTALRLSKPTVRRFSAYECLGAASCEQNKPTNSNTNTNNNNSVDNKLNNCKYQRNPLRTNRKKRMLQNDRVRYRMVALNEA